MDSLNKRFQLQIPWIYSCSFYPLPLHYCCYIVCINRSHGALTKRLWRFYIFIVCFRLLHRSCDVLNEEDLWKIANKCHWIYQGLCHGNFDIMMITMMIRTMMMMMMMQRVKKEKNQQNKFFGINSVGYVSSIVSWFSVSAIFQMSTPFMPFPLIFLYFVCVNVFFLLMLYSSALFFHLLPLLHLC